MREEDTKLGSSSVKLAYPLRCRMAFWASNLGGNK